MASTLALRPTFDLDVEIPPDEAAHRLGAIIGAGGGPIVGETVGHHLMLGIRPRDRHFWSPWLTIEIEEASTLPERSTRVHARFHPHPNVWTAFMLGYLAIGTAFAFAAVFGAVQLSLGQSPWALWIAAGAALVALVMWIAARIGQGLAREQMDVLGTVVHKALVEDEHPAIHAGARA